MCIDNPFLGSGGVPHKIWAGSVQPFGRLLDTNSKNRQTDRQDRHAKYIYIDVCMYIYYIPFHQTLVNCDFHQYVC